MWHAGGVLDSPVLGRRAYWLLNAIKGHKQTQDICAAPNLPSKYWLPDCYGQQTGKLQETLATLLCVHNRQGGETFTHPDCGYVKDVHTFSSFYVPTHSTGAFTGVKVSYFLEYQGADKSLAGPGIKQATATKLCKPLKNNSEGCPSNQVSEAAMTSASDEKWRTYNCFFSRVGLRTYQHPGIVLCVCEMWVNWVCEGDARRQQCSSWN